MDTVMTVDELYDMFVEERSVYAENWYDYEDKENRALAVGDNGTAAEYRICAHRAKQRYKEVDNILREIYKKKMEWKEKGSA